MTAQEPIALAIYKKIGGQIMSGLFDFFALDRILVRIPNLIGSIICRQGMIYVKVDEDETLAIPKSVTLTVLFSSIIIF